MSGVTPGELSASAVINLIASGVYARDVVLTIARGFLPLPQEDLVAVLAYLAAGGDEEIAGQARAAMSDIPSRVVLGFAANEQADPVHLIRLMNATADAAVLETLIRNRAVPDHAVAELAAHAEPRIQDIIVINQARIIRAPEILDALLANPAVTADTRRRALENREEFFEKKARLAALADLVEPELLAEPDDAIADLLQRAEEQGDEPAPSTMQTLTESEQKDEVKGAIWNRIQFMTGAEKVQLAFRGDRTVRLLLVRDRNKLICSAVMRNPRMSEQEA